MQIQAIYHTSQTPDWNRLLSKREIGGGDRRPLGTYF